MTTTLDLFVPGVVYLDIIFTGLGGPPPTGAEVRASGMGSCPGGIANLAVAGSRLGLRTGIGTALSTDAYGEFCARTLAAQEGIDLSASRRIDGHSPVTVSMAYDRERSMITHDHPLPLNADGLVADLPACRAAAVSLTKEPINWVRRARAQGTQVFADVGWDDNWPPEALDVLADCHAFLPNAIEATRYTRTGSSDEALRVLTARVPVVVITRGPAGAIAIDQTEGGDVVHVPAVRVDSLDPTGAGDVFTAGFILGTLRGWPLPQRLAFANLIAALSVRHFGGSLSAPGWGDIADWHRATRRGTDHALADRYAFLDDVIPGGEQRTVRRATATIARLSDAG